MAITRAQVTGLSGLATWLNENAADFFSSVTISEAGNTLTAKDADENVILEIYNGTGGYVHAYRSSSSYISADMYQSGFSGTIGIIKCDNGIIIDTMYRYNVDRKFGMLITKTNNDKIACIFSFGGTTTASDNYLYTKLQHVALGDSTTMSTTTTFTPESGNQTVITPFITNADVGGKSYTPSAGYMPAHSNYSSGLNKFLLGADMYITNGYWCIKDGGAE